MGCRRMDSIMIYPTRLPLFCYRCSGISGWTQYYSTVYQSTVVFNYICCGLFFVFFIAFVVFQGGISKHLQMCK